MNQEVIYKQIGEIIKTRRKYLGLRQEDLSKQLGISRASLANIETGRQNFPVHQLYGLAKALDMTLAELLPSYGDEVTSKNLERLSFSEDLNRKQKEQIVRLIAG